MLEAPIEFLRMLMSASYSKALMKKTWEYPGNSGYFNVI
jgi:hypothetical protein